MTTVQLDHNTLRTLLPKKLARRIAQIKLSWDANETFRRALIGAKRRDELVEMLFGRVDRNDRDAVA